jgi:hypothetical protein
MTTAMQLRRHMCQPIERAQLSRCLDILGVRKSVRVARSGQPIGTLDVWQMTELYEHAKLAWRDLCKSVRPDLDNDHELAVWLNTLWNHIRKLFKRKGVEI